MSVINNNLLLTAPAATGGYQISRSLRFNSPDSAYLSRTPASAGNRKTWTWAGWVKRSAIADNQYFFGCGSGTSQTNSLYFNFAAGSFNVLSYGFFWRTTTAAFRDPSAWYHVVVTIDTTQATANNRIRVYINGIEQTSFSTINNPTQNADMGINQAYGHAIGDYTVGGGLYFNGYLADIYFIDGQQLDPSSFTTTDLTTGQLIPIAYTGGSYGTNGFHLDFADNSSNTATTLGKDTSGNSNNWTPNNLSVNTTNYLNQTVLTGTIYPGAGGIDKIFDGTIATCGPDNGSYVTFTPTLPIPINTSLRVRANVSNSSVDANFKINGSARSTVSLGFPASGGVVNSASTWVTITSPPSSLTSLTFGWTNSWMAVSGIEIDGVVLVHGLSTDSLVDVPTNGTASSGADPGGSTRGNYCTLNPLDTDGGTFANGNLQLTTNTGYSSTRGTIGVSSDKWYWEVTFSNFDVTIGIAPSSGNRPTVPGGDSTSYGLDCYNGKKRNNNIASAYASAISAGDVLGVALDLSAGTLTFYKNGTSLGTAFSSLSGTFSPCVAAASPSASYLITTNFGQRPFAYTAPSGFKALCTANLPTPAIVKPSTVMDTVTYTGNGASSRTISGLGFSPEFIWTKSRSAGYNHNVQDIVRGFTTGKKLGTNLTQAEGDATELSDTNGYVSSQTSDGYVISIASGGSGLNMNASGVTYAGWCWDAGTSTVTNTQGSITSQVRANPTAGFSVVTYTGGASNSTVGHGLGASPGLIIAKSRNNLAEATGWAVYHRSLGGGVFLTLNGTGAATTFSNYWGTPSSVTFGVSNNGFFNNNGNMVAYCFAPVDGYSSFGSYTGNGSSDGPFVHTGFRPRWVMLKASSASTYGSWRIWDTSRSSYNLSTAELYPDLSDAEYNYSQGIDVLSNGFKVRNTLSGVNGSSQTIIYAAFAEAPFQYARAR